MKLFTPVRKVSFGIVMVTVSLLMLAELLGLVPSERRGYLEGRRLLCESFAVQFSAVIGRGDLELVRVTLDNLIRRDGEILSAAIVDQSGREVLQSGDHQRRWRLKRNAKSTATHVSVPIFENNKRWGAVQVTFRPLPATSVPLSFGFALLPLVVFMTVVGFFAYWLFIKRTLKELDPSSVVPERVKSAFDALTEGLVIMDEKENVILANAAFAQKIERSPTELLGRDLVSIAWRKSEQTMPWKAALDEEQKQSGGVVRFETRRDGERTFTVNATPIKGADGTLRGVLATFDDLTDLERKQLELKQTVGALQQSRQELQEKAVELEMLATRDPLTGCFNRRAFFDQANVLFNEAIENAKPLCCIMTDIDHFKAVNDNHGHAMGDEVIQLVATELRDNARPDDVVGRYGGEEFCVVLPGAELEAAVAIADRLRITINQSAERSFGSDMPITASFGVAAYEAGIESPADLIGLADQALYVAKEAGRNRVIGWTGEDSTAAAAASEADVTIAEQSEAKKVAALPQALEHPALPERQALVARITDLEERLARSEQIRTEEMGHDPVTGLPNRLLLMDRIRHAAVHNDRYERTSAVIVLNIDLFRRINDALGFIVGDKVLRKAGERLVEILRQGDTIAPLSGEHERATVSRTGADEFGILLNDLEDVKAVTWIVKRMLDHLSAPLNIDGNEIFISCSAGISLFPHDAREPADLIRHANTARSKAKHQLGRNKIAFYSDDMNEVSHRSLWMEGQMHGALDNGEFFVVYQPKVELGSGRIAGMEALLRWTNPKIGSVSPADFIPVAERTGLIVEIGQWVLQTACAQARVWAEEGFPDVSIAVNLSPLQFRESDLSTQIVTCIGEAGIPPSMIEVEVTESGVMENFTEAVETLKQLAQSGIKIAVDDFGTGYSSLAYLKHLPIHTLKIDRSFLSDTVPDEQDQLIINAIIAMAHSMRLRVVAEGVETEVQRSFLHNSGCDEMQGYLFSKPVDAGSASELLQRHNGAFASQTDKRQIA